MTKANKPASGSKKSHSTRTTAADWKQVDQKYAALLRVLPDLMFVLDREGNYVDFCAGQEGELAIPPETILGKNVRDTSFTPHELKNVFTAMKSALDTGTTQTVEYGLQTLGGFGFFEARLVRLDRDHVISIVRNITERRKADRELIELSIKLEEEKTELQEKNVALEQILNHLEDERRAYRKELGQRVVSAVKPILERARHRAGPAEQEMSDLLEAQLKAIVAEDTGDDRWDRYATLTPREMELCDLLKNGLSSKEISEKLNVSLPTVHKHREQIRKKLGFQNTRVNLTSFLKLHTPHRPT
jgi:PAS domain S-box-containing protein